MTVGIYWRHPTSSPILLWVPYKPHRLYILLRVRLSNRVSETISERRCTNALAGFPAMVVFGMGRYGACRTMRSAICTRTIHVPWRNQTCQGNCGRLCASGTTVPLSARDSRPATLRRTTRITEAIRSPITCESRRRKMEVSLLHVELS